MKKGIGWRMLACIAGVAIFVGCGGKMNSASQKENGPREQDSGQQTDAAAMPQRYYVRKDGWEWVVNQDGTVLVQAQEIQELYDIGETEPLYYMALRYNEPRDDESYSRMMPAASALYSLEGELLVDWREGVVYGSGYGGYVVEGGPEYWMSLYSMDGNYEAMNARLFNPHTGEYGVTYDGSAQPVWESEQKLIAFQSREAEGEDYVIDRVADREGNILGRIPKEWKCSRLSQWKEYLIADCWEKRGEEWSPVCRLLDKEMQPVPEMEYEGMSASYPLKDLLCVTRSGQNFSTTKYIRQPGQGYVLEWISNNRLAYYDGEIAMLSGEFSSALYDVSTREKRSDDYWLLWAGYAGDKNRPECFMAQNESRLSILEPDGNLRVQKEWPEFEFGDYLPGGYFLLNHINQSDGENEEFYDGCAMVNSRLEEVIPLGEYWRMHSLASGACGPVLGVRYAEDKSLEHNDVLSLDGKVLLRDVNIVWDAGSDRLVVDWQGKTGLVDLDGNWLFVAERPA